MSIIVNDILNNIVYSNNFNNLNDINIYVNSNFELMEVYGF